MMVPNKKEGRFFRMPQTTINRIETIKEKVAEYSNEEMVPNNTHVIDVAIRRLAAELDKKEVLAEFAVVEPLLYKVDVD